MFMRLVLVTQTHSKHAFPLFDAPGPEPGFESTLGLQRIYQAEFAKDPTSPATESSRSNMIALRHSINQIYGEAAASDVADALRFATDDRSPNE